MTGHIFVRHCESVIPVHNCIFSCRHLTVCHLQPAAIIMIKTRVNTDNEIRYSRCNIDLSHFRLHRMHAMHGMQPIVTDVRGVCPSVSLSVCHAAHLTFTVQKRLNRSRCCLVWTFTGHCFIYEGPDPHRQGRGRIVAFWDPLQLQIPARAVCAVHSMQPLPNYFGFLLLMHEHYVHIQWWRRALAVRVFAVYFIHIRRRATYTLYSAVFGIGYVYQSL